MPIHPTAIVHTKAIVPESCTVGPYCIIDDGVVLGEHNELISHVNIYRGATIGSHNKFWPYSAVCCEPQDWTYKNEPTKMVMGDHNLVRECATLSRGTMKGGGTTRIGNHTFLMAYAHVGHDSQMGDHTMLINGGTLAGHVIFDEYAVLGAMSAVHQFVHVGAHAYIGGGTMVTQDVLPFTKTVARRENATFGINALGLERRGFSKERIAAIQKAYRIFKRNNNSQTLELLKKEFAGQEDIALWFPFLENTERGVIK